MAYPSEISFNQLLAALLDSETPLSPRYLYRLSDLEADEISQLATVWPQVPDWRRVALMEDIEELNQDNYLLSFEAFCCFATGDAEPKVRASAIRTLWEYESRGLIPLFLNLLTTDNNEEVRAMAAEGLARFVYAGELEELPPPLLQQIEDSLLNAFHHDEALSVRRAALEALGFSSRDEVPSLIEEAFASEDAQWKASALSAMGRSADTVWQPQVLSMLESDLPLLRREAARAAGALELAAARPYLLELLDDPDEDTRLASIWSLSQIGGQGVRQALLKLYRDSTDEQELELLEDALDNLAFTEGSLPLEMFDFSSTNETADLDGWDKEIDLAEEWDEWDEEEEWDDEDYEDDEE